MIVQGRKLERVVPIANGGSINLIATPFVYRNPLEIPPRDWIYGHHLIRRNVAVTVAPGGVGKSSLTIVQALELASGRRLLGQWNAGPAKVWLFNLEDERSELDRRIAAAMMHHNISEHEIEGRLFVDTGREQELILAEQMRDEVQINTVLIDRLKSQLLDNKIDVLIVDPFVSSHRVNEMDNGKIDHVTKEWIRLAEYCGCAIELVHHTRKLNGVEATSDASRGASSLINAARSARVLQGLSDEELKEAAVFGDGSTYFSVKRDKANLAKAGTRETYRTVSIDLGQGDQVGVVELWKKPMPFDGVTRVNLLDIQRKIDAGEYRYSDQAENWVGYAVAEVISLDASKAKRRIKKLIEEWLKTEALEKVSRKMTGGKSAPFVEVGVWAYE